MPCMMTCSQAGMANFLDTHPPGYDISPSTGDREFLTKMNQERSGIWGDEGYTVFGRVAAEDPIIQAQINRAKMTRLYGGD